MFIYCYGKLFTLSYIQQSAWKQLSEIWHFVVGELVIWASLLILPSFQFYLKDPCHFAAPTKELIPSPFMLSKEAKSA